MSDHPLVVVGDALLDRDVEGNVERLCPDAPVPVVDEESRTSRPGGAGLAAALTGADGHHDVVLVTALAGDPAGRELTEMSLEEWDRVQHVNLRAPWLLSRAVFPHMVERGAGQIVNISSTASKKGWENASAYAASKHGVMGLSQALHAEGKQHGVRVMAVVAGGMRTNFFRALDPPPPPENLQPPRTWPSASCSLVCQPAESVVHELIITPMTETSYP